MASKKSDRKKQRYRHALWKNRQRKLLSRVRSSVKKVPDLIYCHVAAWSNWFRYTKTGDRIVFYDRAAETYATQIAGTDFHLMGLDSDFAMNRASIAFSTRLGVHVIVC